MSLLSRTLLAFGAVLLIHACYSAHEYSSLPTTTTSDIVSPTIPASLSTAPSTISSLPLDISLETLVSVLLICVGLVLGAEELQPISWRVWAGAVEKGKGPPRSEGFEWLEQGKRKGFLDIRGQRADFAEWARAQGDVMGIENGS